MPLMQSKRFALDKTVIRTFAIKALVDFMRAADTVLIALVTLAINNLSGLGLDPLQVLILTPILRGFLSFLVRWSQPTPVVVPTPAPSPAPTPAPVPTPSQVAEEILAGGK